MSNMLQLMEYILSYIDSGKIFKQPVSWVYKAIAVLFWLLPLYMLYAFFDNKVFNSGGAVVFGFFIFLLFVTATVFLCFQLWWLRSEDVKSVGGLRGDYFTIPIVCHITRTLGECAAILLVCLSFASTIVIVLFSLMGNKENMNAIPYLQKFVSFGVFSVVVGIVSGFFAILFTRFIAEMMGVMAAIANNTKNIADGGGATQVTIHNDKEMATAPPISKETIPVDFGKMFAPLLEFLQHYWKGLASVFGVLIVGFAVYSLFIKSDPASDGKKIANQYCECKKGTAIELEKFLKQVDENFDAFHFKNSRAVEDTIHAVEKYLNKKQDECHTGIEQAEKALRAKYASNNLGDEFDRQLSIFMETCIESDNSNFKQVYDRISGKAHQIKLSAPEPDQIKRDLVNKSVSGLWYFGGDDNFIKEPEILSEKNHGDEVALLIYCNVLDQGTNEAYDVVLQRTYYRVDNETWRQGGIVGLYVGTSLNKMLLTDNQPNILGRWKYDANEAEYFQDGSWTTTFDGQTSQGTWKISNGVLDLTLNGSPYASMKLVHPTRNTLSLKSDDGQEYAAKRISNGK
ncbi:MAG: hypothetical protein U0T32_06505 [Chitinophagales bacterium]